MRQSIYQSASRLGEIAYARKTPAFASSQRCLTNLAHFLGRQLVAQGIVTSDFAALRITILRREGSQPRWRHVASRAICRRAHHSRWGAHHARCINPSGRSAVVGGLALNIASTSANRWQLWWDCIHLPPSCMTQKSCTLLIPPQRRARWSKAIPAQRRWRRLPAHTGQQQGAAVSRHGSDECRLA